MALSRTEGFVLGGAALFAVAMPVALLWPGAGVKVPAQAADARPVVPPPMPAVAAVYERPLFAAVEASDEIPADAPALVGIAGRLNRDAVALVRLADGNSRSLGVGESVDGWRLESLAIDAAFFTRGRERVRVAMGTPEAAEDPAADESAQ
ncbi:hypothetical protein [Sphingomonas sp. MS122]|uniref:hypothetical protein n=1 Tax=Sphingomonas sp. MS122 TaxID=3412683 RepID=UPI003C2E5146